MQISKATLQRLPKYLRTLEQMEKEGATCASSSVIADRLSLTAIQVRKDLAAVSTHEGKPKKGFDLVELIKDIKSYLGYDNINDAIIVGVGRLGRALMSYDGFSKYGLQIVAGFDKFLEGEHRDDKIFEIEKMPELVRRLNIHIGIITVPAAGAQEVADLMVDAGIKAIWNFAPAHLDLPDNIAIKNEDMAASLAVLSSRLAKVLADTED